MLPMVCISFPSFKDPEWETNHPGEIPMADIIILLPMNGFQNGKTNSKESVQDDYNDLKEKFLLDCMIIL